jgi:hypothetical protein
MDGFDPSNGVIILLGLFGVRKRRSLKRFT